MSRRERKIIIILYVAVLALLGAAAVWGITNCGC